MARPFHIVNRNGSAAISSTGVKVTAENVVFTFQNHAFLNAWYMGTLFVKLSQPIPAGTAGTLPVLFETNGATQAITKYGGEPLTVGDVPGTGVYQLWFEKGENILQLMTGAI